MNENLKIEKFPDFYYRKTWFCFDFSLLTRGTDRGIGFMIKNDWKPIKLYLLFCWLRRSIFLIHVLTRNLNGKQGGLLFWRGVEGTGKNWSFFQSGSRSKHAHKKHFIWLYFVVAHPLKRDSPIYLSVDGINSNFLLLSLTWYRAEFFYFFFLISELRENVRSVEQWLVETEGKLKKPPRFNRKWTQEAIDDKMNQIQVSHNSKNIY